MKRFIAYLKAFCKRYRVYNIDGKYYIKRWSIDPYRFYDGFGNITQCWSRHQTYAAVFASKNEALAAIPLIYEKHNKYYNPKKSRLIY